MRQGRSRKSAKQVITEYCHELLNRSSDPHKHEKLIAIEHIAFKMNWTELYNLLRFKKSHPFHDEKPEEKEPEGNGGKNEISLAEL